MADFVLRLAFFSVAPVGIVFAAELFPVRGALIDVGLALGVFGAGEAAQQWANRKRWVRSLLREALTFETFYRARLPRPFLYYLAYPLLFPYWLIQRDARREFLVFRGYTLGGLVVLLVSLGWQYFSHWAPELSVRQYFPYVLLSLVVEMVLVLALLMPIATTVVWYHSSLRRRRLLVVLLAGLLSTSMVLVRVARRRFPVVSYATRERVILRTASNKRKAHKALVNAAHAGMKTLAGSSAVEGDGIVLGAPLEQAQTALETFYKHDEAYAFNLWASPRRHPQVLVVYFEARRNKRPIWVAIRGNGTEIQSPRQLPKGAFKSMRAATDSDDELLEAWPEVLDLPESANVSGPTKPKGSGTRRAPAGAPSTSPRSSPSADGNPRHAPIADAGGLIALPSTQ
jgi:hypothetical protein